MFLDKSEQIPYIKFMANNVNLLRASFRGKVGAVYGDDSRGVAKVKAIPFSHAPTAPKVKAQCRAFECLNRFSAGIAKEFWKYLSLSDKKSLRHNAVASWLKIGVDGGAWQPTRLGETIGTDTSSVIGECTVNRVSGAFTISASVTGGAVIDNESHAFYIALVDDTGKVIFCDHPANASYAYSGMARLFSEHRYFVAMFQSIKNSVTKKWKTTGYDYKEVSYVEE